MTATYAIAFATVVLLDTLCVVFVFPFIPRINGISVTGVSFFPALFLTFVSAVAIGIFLLEFGGGIFLKKLFELVGASPKLSRVLVKNTYATAAPLFNAVALMLWTNVYPELNFSNLFPDALIAGVILHFIDYGIIVPWFFRIEEAFQ